MKIKFWDKTTEIVEFEAWERLESDTVTFIDKNKANKNNLKINIPGNF